jgi:hypothetical protein
MNEIVSVFDQMLDDLDSKTKENLQDSINEEVTNNNLNPIDEYFVDNPSIYSASDKYTSAEASNYKLKNDLPYKAEENWVVRIAKQPKSSDKNNIQPLIT